MSNLETVEIRVAKGGIHCTGCEARIESVLSRLPGVGQVKADHRAQAVRLALDAGETTLETVKQKLAELGFETA